MTHSKSQIRFSLLPIALLLMVPTIIWANSKDSTRYAIEAKYHLGIVVPHHTSMTYLINDYARGGEINLIRQRHQSGLWESYLNRPETGIGFWFSSFGRPDIYGEGFALYPFINFRLFQLGQLQAKSRVALGLGYANKPFKVGVNTYNTVFGSHLNAYIGFGLLLKYPVTDRVSVSGSFSLNHMSNGSYRKPNNGINTATFTLGAIYELVPVKEPTYHHASAPSSSAREWLTTLSAGRNQAAAYNPTIYWSGSLTTTHLWYKNTTKAYGLGLDFIRFGGAPLASINFQDIDENTNYSFKDELYAGLFGTMESHMGTTSLYIALGGYLYHATKPRQPVYARLGVRQKLTGNLFAHFGIKANFFTAEFIEFGLGYRWRKDGKRVD